MISIARLETESYPAVQIAVEGALARPLDPVENICPQDTDFRPGKYRQQYRAAARDGVWGQPGSSYCGASCIFRVQDGKLQLLPVLCDTWGCKLCGPRKAAWLIRQIKQSVERYNLRFFWTLTVKTGDCSREESVRKITYWWHKLHRRLGRRYGAFSYVWTLELTKRGYAHLHLLTSCEVCDSELSELWLASTGGSFIVKAEPVSSERAQMYITKYCSKQGQLRADPEFEFLRGRRFFSKSQDIDFEEFRTGNGQVDEGQEGELASWRMINRPYWEQVRMLCESGAVQLAAAGTAVPGSRWIGSQLAKMCGVCDERDK